MLDQRCSYEIMERELWASCWHMQGLLGWSLWTTLNQALAITLDRWEKLRRANAICQRVANNTVNNMPTLAQRMTAISQKIIMVQNSSRVRYLISHYLQLQFFFRWRFLFIWNKEDPKAKLMLSNSPRTRYKFLDKLIRCELTSFQSTSSTSQRKKDGFPWNS